MPLWVTSTVPRARHLAPGRSSSASLTTAPDICSKPAGSSLKGKRLGTGGTISMPKRANHEKRRAPPVVTTTASNTPTLPCSSANTSHFPSSLFSMAATRVWSRKSKPRRSTSTISMAFWLTGKTHSSSWVTRRTPCSSNQDIVSQWFQTWNRRFISWCPRG